MTKDTQEVVEAVDDKLQSALKDAEMYHKHDDVRPSAIRAFKKVNDARELLDEIDEREFTGQ